MNALAVSTRGLVHSMTRRSSPYTATLVTPPFNHCVRYITVAEAATL
jgi:hypothetical protein